MRGGYREEGKEQNREQKMVLNSWYIVSEENYFPNVLIMCEFLSFTKVGTTQSLWDSVLGVFFNFFLKDLRSFLKKLYTNTA